MATNMRRKYNEKLVASVICSAPATPASGDPVLYGTVPGIALTAESAGGNAAGYTSVAFDGDWLLPVKGADGSGNAAVNPGDKLYYDSGEINKDVTNGVEFGVAMESSAGLTPTPLVASGATTTIVVRVGPTG